ncbi:hypothetical protein WOLCODRAFT_154797 [Wolfiporia cocos MD-104 SS10]|uniref:Heterokaryon incompatibility domain-containing protein n=1 Tax=Wolfiporia cocos (strain MD-104) TaxID=742152 RepID=A0A2H3JRH7_WOLCO|nr:hypothetical protein WOLCODRAFT_154797 [Wolfiporia cocos MD-104 SS10]
MSQVSATMQGNAPPPLSLNVGSRMLPYMASFNHQPGPYKIRLSTNGQVGATTLGIEREPSGYSFPDTAWLGAQHDSFRKYPIKGYILARCLAPQPYPPVTERDRKLKLAAICQSAMTLGLIEAVTEQNVLESQFLDRTPTGVVITSKNMPMILRDWFSRAVHVAMSKPDAIEQWAISAVSEVRLAASMIRAMLLPGNDDRIFYDAGVSADIIERTALVGLAIVESLSFCIDRLRNQPWLRRIRTIYDVPPLPFYPTALDMARSDLYRKNTIENGWCPLTYRFLAERHSPVCLLSYVSTRPPFARKGAVKDIHSSCTANTCTAHSIDIEDYHIQHVSQTCTCPYGCPPVDAVIAAISADQKPVMTVVAGTGPDGSTAEIVCSYGSNTPYIAISHVWSDGLGSTTEAGLPLCQVRQLAAMTASLLPGRAFWMDALCVPAHAEARKRAIGMMAQIYRDAEAVLVLDSGIRSCSAYAPLEEMLLAVVTSAWMQRVWTLQEGMLAQELVFQFKEALVPYRALLQDAYVGILPTYVGLMIDLFRIRKLRQTAEIERLSGTIALGHLIVCLQWRTTSRPEDETLAIAGLLGVDAYALSKLPRDERMVALLLGVRRIPAEIILMPAAKLKTPGFRWAPRTLTVRQPLPVTSNSWNAICTPDGLIATYFCLFFDAIVWESGDQPYSCRVEDTVNNRVHALLNITAGTWKSEETSSEVKFNGVLCLPEKSGQGAYMAHSRVIAVWFHSPTTTSGANNQGAFIDARSRGTSEGYTYSAKLTKSGYFKVRID